MCTRPSVRTRSVNMSRQVLWFIILCLCLSGGEAISMTPNDYRQLVEARCFNKTSHREPFLLGQSRPVGLSLDYLVSLIETIEERLPHLTARDEVAIILKRFHYDGTEQVGLQNVQSSQEMLHRIVNDRIFAKHIEKVDSTFPEDALTEDEKCAMFFMVSHTVNRTDVNKDDNDDTVIPRELGAVSLFNSDRLAVSINIVLMGLAIGLFDVKSMDINASNSADSLEPLLMVTFADRLAMTSIKSLANVGNEAMFGSEGIWNSTYCQTEYRLSSKGDQVTMADMNGAIDGWILGRKLISEGGQFMKQLKLSTILEQFYSKDGLTPDCGICAVDYLSTDVTEKIRETARGYLLRWNNLYNRDNLDFDRLTGYVEYNWIPFNQYLQKAKSIQQTECSRLNSVQYGNTQCETNTDVFVMVDNNVQQYSKMQLEFVTGLLSKLQTVNYLGTATVFVNALRGFESDQVSSHPLDLKIPLHLMAYNTTSVQLATCRLAWYPYRETTINNKKVLLDHLVTLFERNNVTNRNRGNSRNFVWISLKDNAYRPLNDREKMEFHKYRWYFKYFLNIRTFFVSSTEKNDDDDLGNIVINQEDWYKVVPANLYDQTIVDRLVKKMCDTPVALIYEDCFNATSQRIEQENLISSNKKQYWAIYPKFFIKSNIVSLQFKASGARIRVCLDRWTQPENHVTRNCKEAKTDGDQVEFWVEQPCRWKTIDSCLPIYFTVSIANQNWSPPNDCLDFRCKSLDQVRWTVTHSGLHCYNHSYSLSPHWIALLLMFLTVVITSRSIEINLCQ